MYQNAVSRAFRIALLSLASLVLTAGTACPQAERQAKHPATSSKPAAPITRFQTVPLPPELASRVRALEAAVESRLSQKTGADRIAFVRPLSAGEKDELRAVIPSGAPITADHLVAIDMRFHRIDGTEGFGRIIVAEYFSNKALRGQRGPKRGYWKILDRDPGRRAIAQELVDFFVANFKAANPYPLERVIPLHFFQEIARARNIDIDELSMRYNNTYAFAIRRVRGTSRWSRHAIGAIDINPFYNPIITRTTKGRRARVAMAALTPSELATEQIRVEPLGAAKHAFDREQLTDRHVIANQSSPIVEYFSSNGWTWGGNWRTIKDYHHFSPGDE